jgi:hypothetical protein
MRLTALPIASHDKDRGWMHVSNHGGGLLRARDEGEQPVMPFELFFDLVFIFAVIQLSHRLLEQLTTANALETLLLLLVVWSAWVTTTWVTNWFDPDRMPVRLMLIAVMFASLFMSVAIPEAFGERAHPGEHGTPASVALTLRGTALFLAGHALSWSRSPRWQC